MFSSRSTTYLGTGTLLDPSRFSSRKTTQVESISFNWLQVSRVEKFRLTGHTKNFSYLFYHLSLNIKIVKFYIFQTLNWFHVKSEWQTQCGNLQIFPPRFFCKNFVKSNILLKSYTVNQFDEKISQWGKISEISTLCSDYSVVNERIFRQIN